MEPKPGITICNAFLLPSGLTVWVVGSDDSAVRLSRSLQGKHLILTLANLEAQWAAGQKRVQVPRLVTPQGIA